MQASILSLSRMSQTFESQEETITHPNWFQDAVTECKDQKEKKIVHR